MSDVLERYEREIFEKRYQQGMELGIEQGIEQGMEKKSIQIAKNLLLNGVGLELIVKTTDLDVTFVKRLQEELKH